MELNKKDSERFIKQMLYNESRKMTMKEKKLAEEIKEIGRVLEAEKSTYVIHDGVITFTGKHSFKISKLMKILEFGKKMKKGESYMFNMGLDFQKIKRRLKR